jgi:hypothetical protein
MRRFSWNTNWTHYSVWRLDSRTSCKSPSKLIRSTLRAILCHQHLRAKQYCNRRNWKQMKTSPRMANPNLLNHRKVSLGQSFNTLFISSGQHYASDKITSYHPPTKIYKFQLKSKRSYQGWLPIISQKKPSLTTLLIKRCCTYTFIVRKQT